MTSMEAAKQSTLFQRAVYGKAVEDEARARSR
jgi:hypothetical protein